MDVDALLSRLSAAQLREWEAFYQLEPFGQSWLQTAVLASLIANANRDPDQQPEPFTLEDFLPVEQADGVSTETDIEAPADDEASPEASPEETRPAWMAWKDAMQVYADATNANSKRK